MAEPQRPLSPELQQQLLLEERAAKILARVRADDAFMAGVKEAARQRARHRTETRARDVKRADG